MIETPKTPQPLEPFCKLADPATYVASPWDFSLDSAGREYWVSFFLSHFETILRLGAAVDESRGASAEVVLLRVNACRVDFTSQCHDFTQRPAHFGPVSVWTLDCWRNTCLQRHGFTDPFIDLKNLENQRVLPLLNPVCRQIDALTGPSQFRAIIEGVLAGNIFDMGSQATVDAFLAGGADFFATRQSLKPRPWLVDDYDALAQRLLNGPPHRRCVYFIDNAGSDFILGALPLMRWLAQRGTSIIIAANERPALNDMTAQDVEAWWPQLQAAEPSLKNLPITLVSTGTGEPLIDLSAVSPSLNVAARDADLLIIEGMGRAVESNFEVAFSCDTLKLALIKDPAVAKHHAGHLFDIICKYDPKRLS